jgi:hypothetical protein
MRIAVSRDTRTRVPVTPGPRDMSTGCRERCANMDAGRRSHGSLCLWNCGYRAAMEPCVNKFEIDVLERSASMCL